MARKKSGGERIEPIFNARYDDAEPRVEAERRRGEKPSARKKRKGSLLGRLFYWSFVFAIWGAIGAGGLFVYYGSQLPHIDQLAVPKRPPNIAVLGADGSLLANRGDTGGAAVRLQDLPPYLPKAFVAIEDRRFYSHWGVDPVGIFRAVFRNALGHGVVQGGSTLTQQLAKNLFLTQERTFSRKIQEAILALWLEHKYSRTRFSNSTSTASISAPAPMASMRLRKNILAIRPKTSPCRRRPCSPA